jgi:alanyl-tRNA synthetase
MPRTVTLYDSNPYLKSFQARVIAIKGKELELDQTAFYPEGGGQAGDTGAIGGIRVLDTRKNDDAIIHVMESELGFTPGEELECALNWERRHRIMRLHSAAHIMEHFLWKRLGHIDRLGSFVDDAKDRADYSYEGKLPAEELKKVEEDTNAFLSEGHEISVEEDDNSIRTWRCAGIEMHCGGTHVRNTEEIGMVRLKRKNPGKGKERVETSLVVD